MNLLIASDHAGFELKERMKEKAPEIGVSFTDLGTHTNDSVDYNDFADLLSKKLIEIGAEKNLGVLICGSGVGVSIAANRHPEIRAVLAESSEIAMLGREHNHANVLCLGARFMDEKKALAILSAFLHAKPDQGERHVRRVEKLKGKTS